MLIYVHGFNSSPQSFKARLLSERMNALGSGAEFACPELHHRPGRAIAQLESLLTTASGTRVVLVGSSLGGYYATYLAEKHGVRAALVNPALRPYELLIAYLGLQRNLYTGAEYDFTEQHLAELRALEVEHVTAERYLLLVATADEVLDHCMATARYRGALQVVVEGGDHGFSDFGRHIDRVIEFCDAG